jgi:S-adenosylmethionine:tRNA ribosyltransferase-isomerase
MLTMHINEFNYQLPEDLIAQYPTKRRDESRLLVLDPEEQSIEDKKFSEFINILRPNDLLIFNDTKVIKARLFGKKISGGKVEVLIEKILDPFHAICHVGTSKKISIGLEIFLQDSNKLKITKRVNNQFEIEFSQDLFKTIGSLGHLPLPPYINRDDNLEDENRYQTIFAKKEGAIAAPTAGLHFTEEFFLELNKKNITYDFVTLHVGSGTFQPVKTERIEEHKMHTEEYTIPNKIFRLISEAKKANGRIIAVGTTVMRTLESAFLNETKSSSPQDTNIFIYPGFKFQIVDALFTNFHLPKSTLLMLVSAFAGKEFIFKAYNHAIEKKYRFFSYGDAMFIERCYKQTD